MSETEMPRYFDVIETEEFAVGETTSGVMFVEAWWDDIPLNFYTAMDDVAQGRIGDLEL